MIKNKSESVKTIEIDLTGPCGNIFYLMGFAEGLGRKLGLDGKFIAGEMMKGDYEDAIQIFDYYFGEFVILYR